MKGYGQFCPVSKAAEILNERWTLLIIRELLCGSSRFNELCRGIPLISTALLSQRLKSLQKNGVVERRESENGRGGEYFLTDAGRELQPIVMSFGEWGQRWIRSQIHEEDLDAGLLMWDMRRTIDADAFPPGRIAVAFDFLDVTGKERYWWLVIQDGEVELCWDDPGIAVDLAIFVDLQSMTQIWMGDMTVAEAQERDLIDLHGSRDVIRAIPQWLTRSVFATVARQKAVMYAVSAVSYVLSGAVC